MTTTLMLCRFEQSKLLPEDTNHWAFIIKSDTSQPNEGFLHHATKESYTTRKTVHEKIQNYNLRESEGLQGLVEVKGGLNLSFNQFETICLEVADGRSFDLVRNNCQKYCAQILARLVVLGILQQADVDALSEKGFNPFYV